MVTGIYPLKRKLPLAVLQIAAKFMTDGEKTADLMTQPLPQQDVRKQQHFVNFCNAFEHPGTYTRQCRWLPCNCKCNEKKIAKAAAQPDLRIRKR